MDLNDTPEQASYRQEVRAWLEQNKAQAPPRSGSSEDTELHRRAPRLAAQARRERACRRDLAAGVRRPRARADRAGDRQPGDLAGRGARDPRRDRDRDARSVPHRPRHRRAEEPPPRADAARRRGLVPDVLRAGRRLGPGGGADPRAPERRRHAGRSTGRRCGRRTHSSRRSACCSRAPTPTCPSTRA